MLLFNSPTASVLIVIDKCLNHPLNWSVVQNGLLHYLKVSPCSFNVGVFDTTPEYLLSFYFNVYQMAFVKAVSKQYHSAASCL